MKYVDDVWGNGPKRSPGQRSKRDDPTPGYDSRARRLVTGVRGLASKLSNTIGAALPIAQRRPASSSDLAVEDGPRNYARKQWGGQSCPRTRFPAGPAA